MSWDTPQPTSQRSLERAWSCSLVPSGALMAKSSKISQNLPSSVSHQMRSVLGKVVCPCATEATSKDAEDFAVQAATTTTPTSEATVYLWRISVTRHSAHDLPIHC